MIHAWSASMLRNYRLAQFGSLFSEGVEVDIEPTYQESLRLRARILQQDAMLGLARCARDALFLVHPHRLPKLPAMMRAMRGAPAGAIRFPEDAMIAANDDVSLAALLDGYGRGQWLRWICGRASWWAPALRLAGDPAAAVEPERARALLSGGLRITFDRNFDATAARAATHAILRAHPFQPGTRGLTALSAAFDAGYGHSVEIWDQKDRLVGGCHGVALGRAFFTQARFGRTAEIADLALIALNRYLASRGYAHHDMGVDPAARRFGFAGLEREDAQRRIAGCLSGGRRGRWLADPALFTP